MLTKPPYDPSTNAGMFYSMVRSLSNFDEREVKPIIETLLSTSDREICFVATYFRTLGNIETLLMLQNSKHFQAACMLARSLFELAVDMKLLEVDQQNWIRMREFPDQEKLRCARIALASKSSRPDLKIDVTTHSSFVANNERRLDGARQALWPNRKQLGHWSGLRMNERVARLNSPFEEIYIIDYPKLSWYVHPGLTGVVNLEAETFTYLCSYAFKLAADAYWESLQVMIREFRIERADEKIKQKMKAAKLLPFTKSPTQAEELIRELLS